MQGKNILAELTELRHPHNPLPRANLKTWGYGFLAGWLCCKLIRHGLEALIPSFDGLGPYLDDVILPLRVVTALSFFIGISCWIAGTVWQRCFPRRRYVR